MKILALYPFSYLRSDFWERDIALLSKALIDLGHDSKIVAFKENNDPTPDSHHLILSKHSDIEKETWWKSHSPDAVIFIGWSDLRMNGLRNALSSLKIPFIEILDHEGIILSKNEFFFGIWKNHDVFFENSIGPSLFFWPRAFLKQLLSIVAPKLSYYKIINAHKQASIIAAQTPKAAERMVKFGTLLPNSPPPIIDLLPHCVKEETFKFDETVKKENIIISASRWDAFQKDLEIHVSSLRIFLGTHPDWKVILAGNYPQEKAHLIKDIPQIQLCGHLNQNELAHLFQSAKIYLLGSRYESFCISAFQALACGCSTAGFSHLTPMHWIALEKSGTGAPIRKASHLANAIETEAKKWETNHYNPKELSRIWLSKVGSHAVAQQAIALLSKAKSINADTHRF